MNSLEELQNSYAQIESILGYKFDNKSRIVHAFTHRSFFHEHKDILQEHNERLEFLGDAVLTLIISAYLFETFPATQEGELSQLRAQIVNAKACSTFTQKMRLERFLLISKGKLRSFHQGKSSVLGDLFEAILGAIYLDGGLKPAREFIFSHFSQEIDTIVQSPMRNWKAELQDYTQKMFHSIPTYKVEKEEGPDHEKSFYVTVCIQNEILGEGIGNSKKEAQMIAAENALLRILQE
ncbi:MAG: ribonuclease III [Chlamydiales bacterium]